MKANGKEVKKPGKETCFMQVVTNTMAAGETTQGMARERTLSNPAPSTKASG